MNPKVKVAYDKTWYQWNTVVLRHPIVKWWLGELLSERKYADFRHLESYYRIYIT
jgi:hypothetical protein